MTIYGIDLASPYQDGIDLAAVKRAGFDFVNIKTSQGMTYTNPKLGQWVREARANGLGICTFHWLDNSGSGQAQARRVLQLLDEHGLTHGTAHQCDNESNATWTITRDYTKAMQDGLGRHIAMYTGDWWAASRGWSVAELTPYLWAAPNEGYLSKYPGDKASAWTAGYWGFGGYSLMQYSVSTIAGAGGGKVSKTAIRDHAVWAALTDQEEDDMPSVEQFWKTDNMVPAPADSASYATNKGWAAGNALAEAVRASRSSEKLVRALAAQLDPAAFAAKLVPLLQSAGPISQAMLEAALHNVLGSLDDK